MSNLNCQAACMYPLNNDTKCDLATIKVALKLKLTQNGNGLMGA